MQNIQEGSCVRSVKRERNRVKSTIVMMDHVKST